MTEISLRPSDLWATEEHAGSIRYGFRITDILHREASEFQVVEIVETAFFGRMMLLDGCVMTTDRDEFIYHEMLAHVPMLSHPNPKRVLVIGGGDGGTVREVLKHPSVEEVVLCEIDPMVVEVSRKFFPKIACGLDDPRVKIHHQDALVYVRDCKETFDVILIDSTDPLGPGTGLFTESFYQDVRRCLGDEGIMCNQAEVVWSNPPLAPKVYALLNRVFPETKMYWGCIPTYPGQMWPWCFASKGIEPKIRHPELAEQIEKDAKYFNRDLFSAAFVLPNFLKQQMAEAVETCQLQAVRIN